MTTNLGERGQIVLPKAVREKRGLKPGDDFEVLLDDSEPDVIRLRHIQPVPNAGLVDHLLACPRTQPFEAPKRRPERMRKVRI